MLTIRFFLKSLPLVCQRFLVLLFVWIKSFLSLGILFFLLLSYEIPSITSSVRVRREFLCLDLEKAFDRANRNFLSDLLVAVYFGLFFCCWIATLYNGAYVPIILNNWLTERISLKRSVRQEDALSPSVDVLCIEVLANLINEQECFIKFKTRGAAECFRT